MSRQLASFEYLQSGATLPQFVMSYKHITAFASLEKSATTHNGVPYRGPSRGSPASLAAAQKKVQDRQALDSRVGPKPRLLPMPWQKNDGSPQVYEDRPQFERATADYNRRVADPRAGREIQGPSVSLMNPVTREVGLQMNALKPDPVAATKPPGTIQAPTAIPTLNGSPSPSPTGGLAALGLTSSIPTLNGSAPTAPPSPTGGLAATPQPTRVASAAAPSAPTSAHIAAFRKQTGTAFDPKSRMDMQNMQRLMGGQGTMNHKQYQMNKTAFAMLEKEAAGGVAGLLRKGFGALGGRIRTSGLKENTTAMSDAYKSVNIGRHGPNAEGRAVLDAAQKIGQGRMSVGNKLRGAGDAIEHSKGIQNAINYGTGTIAGGAGLYGAHSMGHSSGRETGITEGFDNGMNLGLEGAKAMQPGDPGWMGRLGDLFTGTDQGPSTAAMRQGLMSDRDKMIAALIKG